MIHTILMEGAHDLIAVTPDAIRLQVDWDPLQLSLIRIASDDFEVFF